MKPTKKLVYKTPFPLELSLHLRHKHGISSSQDFVFMYARPYYNDCIVIFNSSRRSLNVRIVTKRSCVSKKKELIT